MTPVDEPAWFEVDIVRIIHQRQISEHGGSRGVRDESLLESALARPQQLWAYGGNPDFFDLAAAYAFGLAKNHPFLDGNKRTAAVICEAFLQFHGMEIALSEEEKYPEYLGLAAGDFTEESFAQWLRENSQVL